MRAASAASTALAASAVRFSETCRSHVDEPGLDELSAVLGVPDLDPELLTHALTHRSFANENGQIPNNERLEFLGDTVLGLVVTETLYRNYPDLPEGRLAKLRAAVVSAKALAEVARTLGLGDYVRLGRGEETTGGREKASILADTVEAILGAIFLQFGIERAGQVVHAIFDPVIADAANLGAALDWKTSLQEVASDRGLGVPRYVVESEGPDHARVFSASVLVGDHSFDGGSGRSKKEAEQQVAQVAWEHLTAAHA